MTCLVWTIKLPVPGHEIPDKSKGDEARARTGVRLCSELPGVLGPQVGLHLLPSCQCPGHSCRRGAVQCSTWQCGPGRLSPPSCTPAPPPPLSPSHPARWRSNTVLLYCRVSLLTDCDNPIIGSTAVGAIHRRTAGTTAEPGHLVREDGASVQPVVDQSAREERVARGVEERALPPARAPHHKASHTSS